MAQVSPFRAWLPPPVKAAEIAAPPYDVVDAAEAARMVANKPLSFLRVARAEIELPESVAPYAPEVYRRAAENLQQLRRQAPLTQDSEPAFYLYALAVEGHRQVGIVAAAAIDDYDRNVIRKHERTLPAKERDRARHIMALRSQTGPVLLTYRDRPDLDSIVTRITTGETPLFDFSAHEAQIRHTGWRVPAAAIETIRNALALVPRLYIADGHHRAAAASRARALCRRGNPDHNGTEPYNSVLAVLFPASQMRLCAYNRVVRDLNGRTAAELLRRLEPDFDVRPIPESSPSEPGRIHFYAEGAWYCLRSTVAGATLDPLARLDVSLLQNRVLHPHLDIADPRTSDRIDFVGGVHGLAALTAQVDSGQAAAAFVLYPTTVEDLMAIADSDRIMPPKSTWFEPKLRDGLFLHDL